MAGKKITRSDIITSLYHSSDFYRKDIKAITGLFIKEIRSALAAGNTVEMRGLGTFEVRARKAPKSARNPRTGEPVTVEPHGVVRFMSGKELKEAVWALSNEKER
jgi:integration host factor subunit beta